VYLSLIQGVAVCGGTLGSTVDDYGQSLFRDLLKPLPLMTAKEWSSLEDFS